MKDEIKTRLAQIRADKIPQGYKNTPIGILKSDWSYARLDEIAEILTETAGKKQYETLSISAGIGFVNQAKKFGKELSGKQYEKYIVLHKGDFSYNKGNSKAYPQGCIYRLNDRAEAAVPNVFESFRIANGYPEYYEQLFIAGFLNSQLYRFINHGIRDDGLLNLTEKDFYSCIVPVPPLEEQQRIASILSAQDKVIELCERKIEQLKRMKKYYLQNMFPKNGEEYPEIRFKGFTEPWEQRKVKDIADNTYGGGTPQTSIDSYWNGEIPWIQSQDIIENQLFNVESRKHISEEAISKSATKLVPKNSIAIVTRVGVGKLAFMPFSYCTSQDFLSLSGIQIDEKYATYSIYRMLQKEKQNVQGTSIKGITIEEMLSKKIEVPCNRAEQEAIGTFSHNLDTLITLHQRKCEEEKKKKKALQQLLLTGIVRINYE